MSIKKKEVLNKEEREIEANFESLKSIKSVEKFKLQIKKAAEDHFKQKKNITLRVSLRDLEAMKLKSSK